jgi:hypothetical protein
MRRRPLPLSAIFAAPLAILAVSLLGLVSALMGDGAWDWMSWAGLGIPVAVIVWARLRRAA